MGEAGMLTLEPACALTRGDDLPLAQIGAAPQDNPGAENAILVGSPVLRLVLEQARRVADSKVAVLISGESGTGKELVARLIHEASPRATHPLIRVNCAALSESLVESELFGHEKGAFTGATEERAGRFEQADRGTLLLDEISEMSVKLQAKLLRVLEEEEFERVGGRRTLAVDVRIIATTNRDLDTEVAQGNFRADLYYRLNAVQLRLPPLRARRDEIVGLANRFFTRYKPEARRSLRGISVEALKRLTAYDWPGNVRQLRNAIRHACLMARGPEVGVEDLPPLGPLPTAAGAFAGKTLADVERQVILATLHELGGNRTATAARLGITPRTLLNKLNRYSREGDVG